MTSSYANMLAGMTKTTQKGMDGIPKTTQDAHVAVSVLDEVLDEISETPEFTDIQIQTLCKRLCDTVRAAESPIERADSIVKIYRDYLQQENSKDYNQLVSKFAATEVTEATELDQSLVEENNDSSPNL